PQFYGDYYKNCASNLAVNWGELPKHGKWKNGMGIPFENVNLADHLIANGFKSLDDFTLHIQKIEQDFWGKRYYTFSKWKEEWWNKYLKTGIVYSKIGFEYSGVMNKKDVVNYPIQGLAFHCLLWDIIEINKAIISEHLDTRLIGQIHDAIILDVNPKELKYIVDIVKCIMCRDIRKVWDWIIVPLDVDIEICDVDASWAEKKEYKS
ncbi:MAG: DNA polymerase, partial [Lutibacter sp.]